MTGSLRRRLGGLLVAAACSVAALGAQPGPAWFVRGLENPADRREARSDVLDTPVLPGSVMKALTLVAALESQVIEPDTRRMCRRRVTVNGTRYTCTHPDLKRPLSPAEALAYSCNDFFVSLVPRLTRDAINVVRTRLGLPPVAAGADLAAAFVGLDGPRITPRAMLDVVARLAGVDRPVAVSPAARRVLLEGLRGASQYGTASALGEARVPALAKTGTAPMPGGAWMGMLVALEPAARPTRGIVVVAPGVAGMDAAALAVDLLKRDTAERNAPKMEATPPAPRAGRAPSMRISIGGRVTTLDLEDYVARVVTAEGQPRAADAAQQALAVAARTYALANRQRHGREGFDLCDTTHCQVVRPATPAARRAAAATAGRVLVHEGRPASVFYSAHCGGHSELASEVWPGAVDYDAKSHEDEACRDEPGWTSELRAAEIERALRSAGLRGDRLRELRVLQRNASGRVARLRAEGFTPGEISGHDFRMAVGRVAGWQRMKSTAFELQRTGSGYRFVGRGFGHGVGLCVVGAGHRAARGATGDEILRAYYPSLAVAQLFEARGTALVQPASGATRAAPSADVLVALPAAEERHRTEVVSIVRAARNEIAERTGVEAPATIRVTVHPTVEAYGRATGQPWWTSGATRDAHVELLPVSVLQRRHLLMPTLRHEVAHVLLDAALKDRPLWVREGAAAYFAGRDSVSEASDDAACPTDAEFRRPRDAAQSRDAYARAEACFRRALAAGLRWSDVR